MGEERRKRTAPLSADTTIFRSTPPAGAAWIDWASDRHLDPRVAVFFVDDPRRRRRRRVSEGPHSDGDRLGFATRLPQDRRPAIRAKPESDIEDCIIASNTDLRDETERSLVIEKVRVVMNEMGPDQRTAMEMAFFQGLTHTEIAEKTGEPLGTIKTRIRSGLQMLRARFAS